MPDYNSSRVLSLRIDAALLDALRERAEADGRSVSGQIVFFVREHVEPGTRGPKRHQKISGWLSHREVPATHEEFRKGRGEASKRLDQAVTRKARRK